ncbi:MAG: flagellar biosynthesis regulator FlaF [Aestuariivirga sp.]|uniref:flagellar biosynthesis regulator FlaF n=1 Tax=Aestuariivirga sp. TaxID=2650926 RepID=UPI0038D03024
MYESTYIAMLEDTTEQIRDNERRAFDTAISKLRLAQQAGRGTRESVDALLFVNRLWTILLEDLADQGNGLPDSLKASLISIGIWMLRRAEDIRQGRVDDFSALIEVSETIRKGLGRPEHVHSFEAR